MPTWIRRTALAAVLGGGFDALRQPAIEVALVERERSLFNRDQ